MFQAKWLIGMMAILLFSEASMAQAKGYLSRRAEERASQRWTLQEWLEQRDRNRMMDLWLSMNSPSPYEGMLGAAYKSYSMEISDPKTDKAYTSGEGYLTFHASIVGLSFEYENNYEESYNDLSGMLNLRIFGNSIQSTYLALHYGQRTRTYTGQSPSTTYKNQFGQVSLQLYLMKYFGIDGFYRQYLPTTDDSLNLETAGSQAEAGVFIDFKSIRIFGGWYQDIETIRSTVSPYTDMTTQRSGTKGGLKLYF